MTKKKAPVSIKVRVVGECYMFASIPMKCLLCGITIPANTPHTCKRLEKK